MKNIENNRLIAEFMGYNLEVVNNEEYFTHDDMLETFLDDELHFHTDWNWLMEVMDKILNVSLKLDTMELYYDITDNIPNIEETYKSILEFINWFNTENKK